MSRCPAEKWRSRRTNIHVLCGNAAYNKGDRGNLSAQIGLLRRRFPAAHLSLDSLRPEVDQGWYDAEVVRRGRFLSWPQLRCLLKADVVVWGGGALLADNACRLLIPFWFVIIAFVRLGLRKPVMAWAQGLIVETRLGAFFARRTLALCDAITVRDENSLQTVRDLGPFRVPVTKTADPAILIEAAPAAVGRRVLDDLGVDPGRRLFVISPTYWPFYHDRRDLLPFIFARDGRDGRRAAEVAAHDEALRELACRLIAEYQAQVLFLPRYPCEPWRDVQYLRRIVGAVGAGAFVLTRDDLPPPDYLALYHHADLLVSTALHDVIFATAMNLPCVQLYYEPKGRDFFGELSAAERMLDWSVLTEPGGIDRIMRLVRRTLEDSAGVLARAAPHIARLKLLAQQNAEVLSGLLDRGDGRCRSVALGAAGLKAVERL